MDKGKREEGGDEINGERNSVVSSPHYIPITDGETEGQRK